MVKLWWVQKISPRKIKESVWNVIIILMTDYGIWKESRPRPSVLFAQTKLVNLLTYKKPSFVFVPVTSSQIFLSPTTTYASSKDKKNKKSFISCVNPMNCCISNLNLAILCIKYNWRVNPWQNFFYKFAWRHSNQTLIGLEIKPCGFGSRIWDVCS